jgi:hypothetical protein
LGGDREDLAGCEEDLLVAWVVGDLGVLEEVAGHGGRMDGCG